MGQEYKIRLIEISLSVRIWMLLINVKSVCDRITCVGDRYLLVVVYC